jgi:hypothetical protein
MVLDWEGVLGIQLAQDMNLWRRFMKTFMVIRVTKKKETMCSLSSRTGSTPCECFHKSDPRHFHVRHING